MATDAATLIKQFQSGQIDAQQLNQGGQQLNNSMQTSTKTSTPASTSTPSSSGAIQPASSPAKPPTVGPSVGGDPTQLLAPEQRQQIQLASLKTLDNSVANVTKTFNGVTSQLTARQAAAYDIYLQTGGSLQSPAGKELMKALQDPAAPNNIASTLQTQPASTPTPLVQTPFKGANNSIPQAIAGGVPQNIIDNPPDILKEFLESDPQLILNAVLNKYRAQGASNVFLQWFGRNFDRFWGEYLGRIAQQALNGETPTLSFGDFMSQVPAFQAFFADSAVQRGDTSARFANYVNTSGAAT